jgi:hypothetical protein
LTNVLWKGVLLGTVVAVVCVELGPVVGVVTVGCVEPVEEEVLDPLVGLVVPLVGVVLVDPVVPVTPVTPVEPDGPDEPVPPDGPLVAGPLVVGVGPGLPDERPKASGSAIASASIVTAAARGASTRRRRRTLARRPTCSRLRMAPASSLGLGGG